jgi:hypothetical protein
MHHMTAELIDTLAGDSYAQAIFPYFVCPTFVNLTVI